MKDFLVGRGAHWTFMSLLVAAAGCGHTPMDADVDDVARPDDGVVDLVETTSVTVGDNFFDPIDILVTGGATVFWVWDGSDTHNVTFASTSIGNSVTQTSGIYKTIILDAIGVYTYQCTIHPDDMNGTVTVRDLEG